MKNKLYLLMAVVLCILITTASAMKPVSVTTGETEAGQTVIPPYPPLPPGSIEIAYDDGDFDTNYIVASYQQLRVKFTPPPETVGGLLKEARIAWWPGLDGDFVITIKDAVTGTYVNSSIMNNAPSGNWQVVDVSAMGFVIPNNDFYIEVHEAFGYTNLAVYVDGSSYSGRSEFSPGTGEWYPTGWGETGIRAVIEPQQTQYQYCFRLDPFIDYIEFNADGNVVYGMHRLMDGVNDYPLVGNLVPTSLVWSSGSGKISYLGIANKATKQGTNWVSDGSNWWSNNWKLVPCAAGGPPGQGISSSNSGKHVNDSGEIDI